MSNLESFYIKRQLYVDYIPTTFPNNLFTKSCQLKSSLNTNIISLNSWEQQIPLIHSHFLDKVAKYYQGTLIKEIWLTEVFIQLRMLI